MIRAILLAFCLFGCSAVKEIQGNSNDIVTTATKSRGNFEGIIQDAAAIPPNLDSIQKRSNQGILEQASIIEKAQGIIEATSGVKDITPWWATLLTYAFVAVILCGIMMILWNTGIGLAFRKMIGFIPEAKHDQAKLLDEALSGDMAHLRESVAFMRAKDPLLDAAFKKRKETADAELQTGSSTDTQA